MCRDFAGIRGAVVSLIAELLSSSIIEGTVWGCPRSAANCLKWMTALAVRDNVTYSPSAGLRETPFSIPENERKGAVLDDSLPTVRV